jgi:hypothetical protein
MCVCIAVLICATTSIANAQLSVAAPVNNSVVNSPVYLQATAPTCQSLPTASMAYSIDNQTDVIFSGAQSLQTTVAMPSSPPTHILHVKAWSNTGLLCEQDLSLTVGGGVNVTTPSRGATVASPFNLQANASTCGGQSTSSMAYSLDTGTDTIFNGATSLNTSVSASAGARLLRVKAWGNSGAFCETDVNLTVSNGSGLVPPSGAAQYSGLENDLNYSSGSPTNLWQTQPDAGTPGTKSGSTTQVSSPTEGGESISREFTMTYDSNGGGVRWFDAKAGNDSATHFQYDAFVYLLDDSTIMNVELDMNHSLTRPAGQTNTTVYILATQCNLQRGVWQVTVNQSWVDTNATCTTSLMNAGTWHHVQIQTHHDASGGTGVHYDAVAIDGNVTNITSCKNPSTGASVSCTSKAESLNWDAVIGPNFQLDGLGSGGSATAYVDKFTVYYW